MLIRQLFDEQSYTYTYIIGDLKTNQAALIDPVVGKLSSYLQLIEELNLTLSMALDTHVHADHITALGVLREQTQCETYVGNENEIACADSCLRDGQVISLGKLDIQVIYTPGHTDDSYCFYVNDSVRRVIFTGDTLLIRGTGRTDFQNGDAAQLFDSLHEKVLTLPDDTVVYPGHDYKGWTSSTIAEERKYNPRATISCKEAFIEHMKQLKLPNPKLMDIAVPANRECGKAQ